MAIDYPHPVSRYRLKFDQEGDRLVKDVEFEAADAFEALTIAHQEARRHSAELWRDGRKLCSITRQTGELWEVVGDQQDIGGRDR